MADSKPTKTDLTPVKTSKSLGNPAPQREVNGPKGPEPTRFGDWEKGGRCFDF